MEEVVEAENLARRSQRQKELVLTYISLQRLNDVGHKRILDGLYALGYTSDDLPNNYELRDDSDKKWDQVFNRCQVLNERSECFDHVFSLLYLTYKNICRLESDATKTRRCSAENEGAPSRINAQEQQV